jgi:hypothetical protein
MLTLRIIVVGLSVIVLSMQAGCSIAVKEARGAHAKVVVIQDVRDLDHFRGIALGRLDTNLGTQCPKNLVRTLKRSLQDEFETVEGSKASLAPLLRVDAIVDYYQKGGGVKAVIGTEARCHVRLKLHAEDDEQPVADLIVPGVSGAIVRAEHDHLAKAITKSILEFLDDRGLVTPDEKKERDDPDDEPTDDLDSAPVAKNNEKS